MRSLGRRRDAAARRMRVWRYLMFWWGTGSDDIYVIQRPFLGLDAVSILLVGEPMRQTGRQAKIIDPYCPTFLRGPPPFRGPRPANSLPDNP